MQIPAIVGICYFDKLYFNRLIKMKKEKLLSIYCEYLANFSSHKKMTFITDDHFKVVFSNELAQGLCNRLGIPINPDSTIFDITKDLPHAGIKRQLYEDVIMNHKTHGYFITHQIDSENETIVHRVALKPIIHGSNLLIGMEIEIIPMETLPTVSLLHEGYFMLNKIIPKLTQREQEIIFLKSTGKTNAEISDILNKILDIKVTEKTINNITLQQIYPKLGVFNKKELLQKISFLGLDRYIPRSLITDAHFILFSSATI